jgi:hypothetical protein
MGQDWIERLLEAKKARESEASQRAQIELERVARIRAAGPDLAKLLLTAIQNAVAQYNQLSPTARIDCHSIVGPAIIVRKTEFPSVTLQCHPDVPAAVIRCQQTTVPNSRESASTREFVIRIDADVSGNVYLVADGERFNNADEAAELLLTPVFSA